MNVTRKSQKIFSLYRLSIYGQECKSQQKSEKIFGLYAGTFALWTEVAVPAKVTEDLRFIRRAEVAVPAKVTEDLRFKDCHFVIFYRPCVKFFMLFGMGQLLRWE